MAALLHALAFLLAAAAFGVALSSMPHVLRARRAGVPFWYGGLGWYGAPSRHMPEAARPHARLAMRRWLIATGLFVLAALAGGLAALQD
ncbi:hypothetical protein [Roseomonas sp. AR75]|jgi:hypothetical protein|uniref:hypothetical protein n=1 Tax=Roseomonas sp. AR75 TaxID=2562311 RepID=UPI0010BF97AD|nr:hypothetical protein [Roseomonas sp. AR75]